MSGFSPAFLASLASLARVPALMALTGLAGLMATGARAEPVSVMDETGRRVEVPAPPRRIVSLAPHLTEILFSLGIGERVAGTVSHSDFPDAAKKVKVVGDAFSVSVEAVVAEDPELILGWTTGGNARAIERLRSFGFPIYMNEPTTLEGVADTVYNIAVLGGVPERGETLRREYLERLAGLVGAGPDDGPAVFFQIADARLYTVNGEHLIGQALSLCGANNIFHDVRVPVPMVSFEQVVALNPEIIVVARPREGFVSAWADDWERLGWLERVRYIEASEITRPGLRMAEGVAGLCRLLAR